MPIATCHVTKFLKTPSPQLPPHAQLSLLSINLPLTSHPIQHPSCSNCSSCFTVHANGIISSLTLHVRALNIVSVSSSSLFRSNYSNLVGFFFFHYLEVHISKSYMRRITTAIRRTMKEGTDGYQINEIKFQSNLFGQKHKTAELSDRIHALRLDHQKKC